MSNQNCPLVKRISADDILFAVTMLQKTASLNTFRRERVLITGGTGFFGKWLTQILIALNNSLHLENQYWLLSRDPSRALRELPWLEGRADFQIIAGDVRTFRSDLDFSTIIHGAVSASQALNEQRPDEMFSTILAGTENILKIAESSGCRRFQLISSGGAYGTQPPEMSNIPETYLGAPLTTDEKSAYGEGKRAAELLAAIAQRRLRFKLSIPRCFAFIGPYLPLDTHFAAGNFMLAALENRTVKIGGDGTPFRSYLYAADLIVWLLTTLINDGPALVNIGSSSAISIKALAESIVAQKQLLFGSQPYPPIEIAQVPIAGKSAPRYVPDVERAKREFGLEAWTPLHIAIQKTLLWHQQN